MEIKTGVELIAIERLEQLEKHSIGVLYDVISNKNCQLAIGATLIATPDGQGSGNVEPPENWHEEHFTYMMNKPYKERLIIAGALIAAEIDRVQWEEKRAVEEEGD